MSQNGEPSTPEERCALAEKAVSRLIAEAEAKRLLENKELAKAIAACICGTGETQLRVLKWSLEQHEPERP
jgi:hypothetical protein